MGAASEPQRGVGRTVVIRTLEVVVMNPNRAGVRTAGKLNEDEIFVCTLTWRIDDLVPRDLDVRVRDQVPEFHEVDMAVLESRPETIAATTDAAINVEDFVVADVDNSVRCIAIAAEAQARGSVEDVVEHVHLAEGRSGG